MWRSEEMQRFGRVRTISVVCIVQLLIHIISGKVEMDKVEVILGFTYAQVKNGLKLGRLIRRIRRQIVPCACGCAPQSRSGQKGPTFDRRKFIRSVSSFRFFWVRSFSFPLFRLYPPLIWLFDLFYQLEWRLFAYCTPYFSYDTLQTSECSPTIF